VKDIDIAGMPATALDSLDSLLRGEIAAAETYQQALEVVDDGDGASLLRMIQRDHGDAIRYLYDRISSEGKHPSVQSGIWGFFARAVEGTAATLGMAPALTALRQGEEQGLSDYESALRRGGLPTDCRRHFAGILIPQQHRHIAILTRLLANPR
jgi:hypothetical protein